MKRFDGFLARSVFISALLIITTSTSFAQGRWDNSEAALREEISRVKLLEGATAVGVREQIEQTESWLDQAAKEERDGNRENATRYYKRVRFSLEMLGVSAATGKLKEAISEQDQIVATLPDKVSKLKAEVADLEAEKANLQKEIQSLTQAQ